MPGPEPDADFPSGGRPGTVPGMSRHLHRLMGLAVTSPLWATAATFAQNAPRDPTVSQKTPIFLGYLAAAIFAGILIVLTLLPSKRQHEDL